jgi:threonine dehydratase
LKKRCEDNSVTYISDSVDPKSAAGEGGTIGIELLRQIPQLKNVIMPLEKHALAEGLVALVKKKFPDSLLIGVNISKKGSSADVICKASKRLVGLDHQIEVTEDAATWAQKWYLEHHLSLIAQEGAGALAAALDPSFPKLHGPTAIILTSNCCDPSILKTLV